MAERSPLFLGLVRPPKLLGLPIMYAMVWLFGSVLLFVWVQHIAVLAEDVEHVQQQIAEIHRVQLFQPLLILRIKLGAAIIVGPSELGVVRIENDGRGVVFDRSRVVAQLFVSVPAIEVGRDEPRSLIDRLVVVFDRPRIIAFVCKRSSAIIMGVR